MIITVCVSFCVLCMSVNKISQNVAGFDQILAERNGPGTNKNGN